MNVTVGAKAGARAGVCEAKVIRGDGTVEYFYSVPKVPWWRFAQRRWVQRQLAMFEHASRPVTPGQTVDVTVQEQP